MYYLVQFVDDGILDIKTDDYLRTREDGRKEAQYGDTFYLCTIIFKSGESEHFFVLIILWYEAKLLDFAFLCKSEWISSEMLQKWLGFSSWKHDIDENGATYFKCNPFS